jgi:hypothetical protein
MKSGDLSEKSNTANKKAIIHYNCIFCGQIISHDKRYTDRKGRPISLDDTGQKLHDCNADEYQGPQP